MNVSTILVPTDFSDDANKAVSTASELAELLSAKIVILHAYSVDVPMASPMAGGYSLPVGFYEKLRSSATSRVDEAAKKLRADGIDATGIAVCEPAAFAIADHAESLPAELIVMGTRGNTGLKHVLLGSVAERVVRTAPCPVLVVKA